MPVIGPDLTTVRERAKTLLADHFVSLAERDGTQATLRAMYVRKAEQAQLVLAGGSSRLIEGEAKVRGITATEMAQMVLSMAAAGGDDLEIERMRVNVAIDAAGSAGEIVGILAQRGVAFTA